jgi:exo-1,4-beta-D-glucosaminidase
VDVQATAESDMNGEDGTTRIAVENPSNNLAFFVHFKVIARGGRFSFDEEGGRGDDEVLPILWSDNYVSLLPGEKRQITATYAKRSLRSGKPVVVVDGWNIVGKTL